MRAEQRAARDAFLDRIGAQPIVMGILNLTPDSFSDGGQFQAVEVAVAHARRMVENGCDIVDIGGESTRPGATPVSEDEEWARVAPTLEALAQTLTAPISIDTYKAAVAARAVAAGAILVNDVWGLQKDPAMAETVAGSGAAVAIMHNRVDKDESLDILDDIRGYFDRSLALAARAGIPERHIVLDPGIGFGKTARQNIEAVARLDALRGYGRPILIGVSRKKFFGTRQGDGVEGELIGTIAACLAAAAAGASIFRVHDVAEHVAALKVFHTIRSGRL
jgi:dihydropteroate synthase